MELGKEFPPMSQKITAPGLPAIAISRPRLNQMFSSLLDNHDALAIFAAAGSGKTVQAQLFAQDEGWPMAWLTLDKNDESATRMLEYLAASLSAHVPNIQSVLADAFHQYAIIEETAAMMASNVITPRLLIVIDNCEMIAHSTEACSALETFLDYLPNGARTLLLSREELGFSIGRHLLDGHIGRIRDDDLSLTMEEATNFATVRSDNITQVAQRWNASLGWIAGFIFGSESQYGGQGRDLKSYVAKEVFSCLPVNEQIFLLETSILESVTQHASVTLCGPEGRLLWRNLTQYHLPATTSADRAIVYHPIFRDFLREEFAFQYPDRMRELQTRHVDLLIEAGELEEAVELLLSLNMMEKAANVFEKIAHSLVWRGDWSTLLRWTERLGDSFGDNPILVGGYIKALRGTRRLHQARSFIRSLQETDRLQEILDADPSVIAHIGWCMMSEPLEALDLLNRYDSENYATDVRYMLEVTTKANPALPPLQATSVGTDRLVSWGYLLQGRLLDLVSMLPDMREWPPQSPFTTPHPLLGLLWRGEVSRARELLDQVSDQIRMRSDTDLWHYIEGWILLVEGDAAKSVEILELAIVHSRNTGFGFEPVFQTLQGIGLTTLGKTSAAITILLQALDRAQSSGQICYAEWAHTALGQAYLSKGDAKKAADHLRMAVDGMVKAQRLLMLPMASIYLSEAEWILGDEASSDRAALMAYRSSEQMGAFPPLQLALKQFPTVFQRQMDRHPEIDWKHFDSTAELLAQMPISRHAEKEVLLRSFGPDTDILVNGEEAGVGRLKVLELVCYLMAHPKGVKRLNLQFALFPESDRRKGSNHLRQVVYQLQKCTGLTLERRAKDIISWSSAIIATSIDIQFENALRHAKDLVGQERLERLLNALKLSTGIFMPASNLEWISVRRDELEVLMEEAELEASLLALKFKRYNIARQTCESLLVRNPYLSAAYKILMITEIAVGSEPAVLAVYLRSKKAFEEIGLEPDMELVKLINSAKKKVLV